MTSEELAALKVGDEVAVYQYGCFQRGVKITRVNNRGVFIGDLRFADAGQCQARAEYSIEKYDAAVAKEWSDRAKMLKLLRGTEWSDLNTETLRAKPLTAERLEKLTAFRTVNKLIRDGATTRAACSGNIGPTVAEPRAGAGTIPGKNKKR